MFITWFTQVPEAGQPGFEDSFASYYQYDTVTRQFSRVRLELGRTGSNDSTFASAKEDRAIGFTTDPFTGGDYKKLGIASPWTVNDKGLLCNGATVLSDRPFAGATVFDTSEPTGFVHEGRPVTKAPYLPPGIEAKHLTLLANEAIAGGEKLIITEDGERTADELAGAIKEMVCEIVEVPVGQFAAIPDEKILAALKAQAEVIRDNASQASREDLNRQLDAALDTAAEVSATITRDIEAGRLTPNVAFERAFASAQAAITRARQASGRDVGQALTEIRSAQESLVGVTRAIEGAQLETAARQMDGAADSLSLAEGYARVWGQVEAEYEPLTEADNLGEYLDCLEYR